MTALPTAASFTGSTVTEAQFKTAITDLRGYLAGLLGTDGLTATGLATLGSLLTSYVTKSAAYTVLAADRGKLINCTATLTLTTPAAATVGAGFAFGVRNSGAGTVTVDGNAAETVDGASTLALGAGESALFVSTGTAWLTVGRNTVADGSVTIEKLASPMGVEVLNYNTSQNTTTSYVTYFSDTITIDADDAVSALAVVAFALDPSAVNRVGTLGIRLLVAGATVATNTVAVESEAHATALTIAGRVTGLTAGPITVAVQVLHSGLDNGTSVAAHGSLLLIKEPT